MVRPQPRRRGLVPPWVRWIPLFPLLFTYTFVASGIVVSVVLVVLSLVLWPFSKNTYRRISSVLASSVLGQFAWICHDWAGIDLRLFGEPETLQKIGKEFSLLTISHRGDIDWVAGFLIAAQFNFVQTVRSLPKNSVKYVPGLGPILWALECPFLARSFAKDEMTIKTKSEVYRDYPFPIQVCLFCEGTRFTEAKYQEGVKYAKERGLPVLKHHLVPRTKGFAVLAHYLRTKGNFSALYDVGIMFPGVTHTPNFLDLFFGTPMTILVYGRRFPLEDLPEGFEELCDYCYKLYQHKDEAYDYCLKHGTYSAPEYHSPISPDVVWRLRLQLIFWMTTVVVLPCVFILLFLSWSTIIFLTIVGLLFNGILTVGLLFYSHQPMGTPESQKKTE